MLRSVSDLKQFTIAGTDGSLGSVSDLYFDDRSWAVRYLVVEDTWLPAPGLRPARGIRPPCASH